MICSKSLPDKLKLEIYLLLAPYYTVISYSSQVIGTNEVVVVD